MTVSSHAQSIARRDREGADAAAKAAVRERASLDCLRSRAAAARVEPAPKAPRADRADQPQLAKGFEIERVSVADEVAEGSVLRPQAS